MTLKFYKVVFAAVMVCTTLSACSSDDDDDNAVVIGDNLPAGEFAFSEAAFTDYTRVDRVGMPAIATALIASDDDYNAADPIDDVAGNFVPEILGTLTFLHDAVDTQLEALGVTPCTVVGDGTGTCAVAAVPLIIPDTLSINTENAAGFPNGRLLTDTVIAATIAVALIELTGDNAQPLTALVGVVNPPANDAEFSAEFPFLADPN